MSDYETENLLRTSFAQFETVASMAAPAPDRARVVAIANRRQSIRMAVIGAAAALVVAVPVVAWAVRGPHVGPTPPGPASSTSATPQPSESAAGTSAPPSAATLAPIELDELARSTVDIPAWPAGAMPGCPSGLFRFEGRQTPVHGPGAPPGLTMEILKTVPVDVDRDGLAETAVLLSCWVQGGSEQVLVVDRDPSGKIVTLGQVVGGGSGVVRSVLDIRADAGGGVGVEVGDVGSLQTSEVAALTQRQWRSYTWDGSRFRQSGGPTTFPPNPNIADLTVTASDLRLGPVTGGARHGTLTVTVTNNGPGSPPRAHLDLLTGDSLHVDPPAGVTCTLRGVPPAPEVNSCDLAAAPAAGRSVTLTFQYTTVGSAGFEGPQPPGKATVSGIRSDGGGTMDTKANNDATFQVIVVN